MLLAAMFVSMVAFAQSNSLEGDVNKDGKVDVADIVKVIDIMAAGEQPQTTVYYWFVGKDGDEVPFNENDIKPSDSEEAGWRMESSKPSQIHPEVDDYIDFESKYCVIVPTEWNFVACDTGGNPEPGGYDQEQITVNGINYTKWVQLEAQGGLNAVFCRY